MKKKNEKEETEGSDEKRKEKVSSSSFSPFTFFFFKRFSMRNINNYHLFEREEKVNKTRFYNKGTLNSRVCKKMFSSVGKTQNKLRWRWGERR